MPLPLEVWINKPLPIGQCASCRFPDAPTLRSSRFWTDDDLVEKPVGAVQSLSLQSVYPSICPHGRKTSVFRPGRRVGQASLGAAGHPHFGAHSRLTLRCASAAPAVSLESRDGITIAQRNPQAHITALDWPNVLAVSSENATKFGVADRHSLLAGDAFAVKFGGLFFHHF